MGNVLRLTTEGSAEAIATVAMGSCATPEPINVGRRGVAPMPNVETEKCATPHSTFAWASANATISVLEGLFVLPACVNRHRVAVTVIAKMDKRVTPTRTNASEAIARICALTQMKPASTAEGVLVDLVEIHREDIVRITNKTRMSSE